MDSRNDIDPVYSRYDKYQSLGTKLLTVNEHRKSAVEPCPAMHPEIKALVLPSIFFGGKDLI